MNWKKFITGLIIASAALAIVLIALIAYLAYEPGNTSKKGKADSLKINTNIHKDSPIPLRDVYYEPTVEITQAELYKFEWDRLQKNELMVTVDSLKRIENYLRDSIKGNAARLSLFQDSILRANANAKNSIAERDNLRDTVARYRDEVRVSRAKKISSDKNNGPEDKSMQAKLDTAKNSTFKDFAKMYESANAASVAKILEQLNERDAAKILKLMNKKKSGKVLEAMKPENAAAIILLGVGQ